MWKFAPHTPQILTGVWVYSTHEYAQIAHVQPGNSMNSIVEQLLKNRKKKWRICQKQRTKTESGKECEPVGKHQKEKNDGGWLHSECHLQKHHQIESTGGQILFGNKHKRRIYRCIKQLLRGQFRERLAEKDQVTYIEVNV
ncbi:hypothetical protein DMENIID0001_140080 [Sergentomyia squamirostris]